MPAGANPVGHILLGADAAFSGAPAQVLGVRSCRAARAGEPLEESAPVKLRKGDLVAFEVRHKHLNCNYSQTRHVAVKTWATWHIAKVRAGTRAGGVRELEDAAGRRWLMLKATTCTHDGYTVTEVRPVPNVDGAALFDGAGGRDFGSIEQCRDFARRYLVAG